MVIHEYLWTFMDIHGYTMEVQGYPWISIGLLDFWAFGLLDFWTFDFRTLGLLGFWAFRLLDFWTFGLLGIWTFGRWARLLLAGLLAGQGYCWLG